MSEINYNSLSNEQLIALLQSKDKELEEQEEKYEQLAEAFGNFSAEVFYNPEIATKEIVDEVFATVNDRIKLIKTLTIAKSAIRHNMAKDLPKMTTPTCIIWGRNDKVTPPNVAEEFDKLLPNSELFWIDKCGHAAMMEHPEAFNQILFDWLQKKNL